jgi:phage terminase Nu1 subunit (DNA packaging protein)
MGFSIRAYARHRGVTDKAVRKAITAGRITPNKDGTINAKEADKEWKDNTDKSKQRPIVKDPNYDPEQAAQNVNQVLKDSGKDVDDGSSQGHPSFIKIKTAHELYKAQLTQLALQERKGQLINKEMVKAQIFKLGRQVRDSWVNWPARIAPLMAKELEVDEHALHTILEKYVREHLNDIGEGKLKLD